MNGRPDRHGSSLPGVSRRRRENRIVLHVDMDCFYASCERRREPALEREPLVVGMGYELGGDRGAVATASYEARRQGVESAQAISVALDRLPNREAVDFGNPAIDLSPSETGFYRPVDLAYYRSVSEEVREILRESAGVMREVSIDEAYLDVTDRTSWEAVRGARGTERTLAEGFARHIRERIAREVGVRASIGVAPNMSAAKIASDFDKPDGLVVVPPGEVGDFLAPISIEEVHGIGPVRARALGEMGIETAGDLAEADVRALTDRFGERGRDLYDRARGVDDRPVTPKGDPKSVNRESAFGEATDDEARWREVVRELAREVAERAAGKGALYRTIGIKVVTPPFEVRTRARSLSGPIQDPELVERVALELLTEFSGEWVRKLGVRVSNLQFASAEQSSLGNWNGTDANGNGHTEHSRELADEPFSSRAGRGQASLADFDR